MSDKQAKQAQSQRVSKESLANHARSTERDFLTETSPLYTSFAWPSHHTTRPLRQTAVLNMQPRLGNTQVQQLLKGKVQAKPVKISTSSGSRHEFIQRSELSSQLNHVWRMSRRKGVVFDELRALSPGALSRDADTRAWLAQTFDASSDDYWLAITILEHGPEPHWGTADLQERQRRASQNNWPSEPGNIIGSFNVGANRTPVRAFYFPGTSDKRALIVGGVHGSEAAGVEVVEILLERMRAPGAAMPYYSVIIVPVLFPENLARHRRKTPGHRDPNRQMPAVGSSPGANDTQGDPIEPENLVLLDLIERFQPERVASAHGHSPPRPGGADMPSITTDPRSGHEAEDDALALDMARTASGMPGGARVPGNHLGTPQETARYPTSSAPHEPGVTFGEYGSHATPTRAAMNIITIETYANFTSAQARTAAAQRARRIELESIATVLRDIFLGPPRRSTP